MKTIAYFAPLILLGFLSFILGNTIYHSAKITHKCEIEKSVLREQIVKQVVIEDD